MKKIAGLVVALVAVFSLTACGSSTKYDFTCTGDIDGQKGTISGIVKDGKVTKLVSETKEDASSAEEAKKGADVINAMGAIAKDSGMEVSAKVSGKTVSMIVTIDVAKAAKAAEEAGEDADDNTLGIDLSNATKDAIIKAFEKQGLKCK